MKNTILTNTVHFEGKIVHLRKTIDKYEVLLLNLFQLIPGSGQFFIICSEIPDMPDIDVVIGQSRGQSFSVSIFCKIPSEGPSASANLHLHHCNNVTLCLQICRRPSVHPELRRLHPAGHSGRTNPGLTRILFASFIGR